MFLIYCLALHPLFVEVLCVVLVLLGQNFLLVDVRGKIRFRVGDDFVVLDISRTNSKTSKVNQQSVLNLEIFHTFPKN